MGKVIKKGATEADELDSEAPLPPANIRRTPIIDKDTFEARSEAKEIRDRAKAEANKLLQDAREEANQIREQAREEGYSTGRSDGASELTEAITKASARLSDVEEQLTSQLTELTVAIARKILGQELQSKPEAVLQIVKNALAEKARQRQEINLRVNPEDWALIRENKSQLLDVLSRAKEIGISEDPDVERYGVIIETDAGTIDAQLDSQLAVFERILENLG